MGANLKLKGLRVSKGKTQQDIAKVLGISETAYNMKERGYREFTRPEIKKLYKFFELTPVELIDIFFADEVHAKGTKRTKPA